MIVAGSSMHGKVSAHVVTSLTGIPYSTVWVALRCMIHCYLNKIQHRHELLPSNFVKGRAVVVWTFQKMAEDED